MIQNCCELTLSRRVWLGQRCVYRLHCRVHRLLAVLPHLLTLTNLAAGIVCCISLVKGDYQLVPWCLLVSAVADFLDGFAARAAGVSGPFGRELDSLADMVSFGVSPALMAVVMLGGFDTWWQYTGLLIALLSAVRLARFNIEQADTKHFIGLATPANTLLWVGLFMVWYTDTFGFRQNLSQAPVLIPLIVLSSYLLVSNFAYFSNKLNPLSPKNWPVWLVLACIVVTPFFIGWAAIPLAMGLYMLSPIVWKAE